MGGLVQRLCQKARRERGDQPEHRERDRPRRSPRTRTAPALAAEPIRVAAGRAGVVKRPCEFRREGDRNEPGEQGADEREERNGERVADPLREGTGRSVLRGQVHRRFAAVLMICAADCRPAGAWRRVPPATRVAVAAPTPRPLNTRATSRPGSAGHATNTSPATTFSAMAGSAAGGDRRCRRGDRRGRG